jgi:DNA polymerase
MSLTRDQMLAEMGLAPLWRERGKEDAVVQPVAPAATSQPAAVQPRPVSPAVTMSPPIALKQDHSGHATALSEGLNWTELRQQVSNCRSCPLCQQRKQAVFGVGDPQAEWLFIGEGPGADEDVQGEPFVGQAGKLLDNMLAALDLVRGENVYIANAVKCRPPGNRTPEVAEMAACRPYLERQIALLKPKIIVLLGKAAVHAVLHDDKPLGGMRGQRHDYQGIPVVVTYHPAYLLRNLPEKSKAWEDLLFARRLLRSADGV